MNTTGWIPSDEATDANGLPTVLRRHDGELLGAEFHVYAVRVRPDLCPVDGEGIHFAGCGCDEYEQEAVNDPCDRLDDFYAMDQPGEPYKTIEIKGFPGDWVVIAYPKC